jgi:hypothetical protein
MEYGGRKVDSWKDRVELEWKEWQIEEQERKDKEKRKRECK